MEDRRIYIDDKILVDKFNNDHIKYAYFMWNEIQYKHLMFVKSGFNETNFLKAFNQFYPFFVEFRYDCIFIKDDKFGLANVTAISSNGIRVEYLFDTAETDNEWINLDMIGNYNATKRNLVLLTDYEKK